MIGLGKSTIVAFAQAKNTILLVLIGQVFSHDQ